MPCTPLCDERIVGEIVEKMKNYTLAGENTLKGHSTDSKRLHHSISDIKLTNFFTVVVIGNRGYEVYNAIQPFYLLSKTTRATKPTRVF